MDNNLINKVDELINIFEESDEINRIKLLKKEIYQDKEIKEKIERFNLIKQNPYSTELIEIRKELLNNPKIKEYKSIENNLLLLILSINQKLNNLTTKKGCHFENH